MVKNRRLFTAGKRLRALRELMGLSRPQFAELVGMTAKRLENIENERSACTTRTSRRSAEPSRSSATDRLRRQHRAAVDRPEGRRLGTGGRGHLVERNPVLLERHGIDMQAWRERHREIREALLAAEQAPEAEPAPLEEPPEPRRQRKRKTPASGRATEAHRARNEGKYLYMVYVVRKRCLFRAGRAPVFRVARLTGLNRPQFSEVVGMDPKRLENIESGRQRMHDEDFEKVCGTFPEFSDWIAYEGSIEPQSIAWKIAEAAQEAAVYLVERNPELLELHGLDVPAWREKHREILRSCASGNCRRHPKNH